MGARALFHDMAAYTTHAVERRAEREIKHAYIELCLRQGVRSNAPMDPDYASSSQTPFLNRHDYNGLAVISVPNKQQPTIITAYWKSAKQDIIEKCIEEFKTLLRIDKERRDEHAMRSKKSQKPRKSGSKSTKIRNTSVDLDAEDLDDLDY